MKLPPNKIQYEIEVESLAELFKGFEQHYKDILFLINSSFKKDEIEVLKETKTEYKSVDGLMPPNCPQSDNTWLRVNYSNLRAETLYAIDQHKGYGNRQIDERFDTSIYFKDTCIFCFYIHFTDPSAHAKNCAVVDFHFAKYFDNQLIISIIHGLNKIIQPVAHFYEWNKFSKSRIISPTKPFYTSFALVELKNQDFFDLLSSNATAIFHSFLPELDNSRSNIAKDEKVDVNIIDRMSEDLCPTTTTKSTKVENEQYKLSIFQRDVDHKSFSHMASNSHTFWTRLFNGETKMVEIHQRHGPSWSQGITIEFFEPIEEENAENITKQIEQIFASKTHPYSPEIKKSLKKYKGFSSFEYPIIAESPLEVFNRFFIRFNDLMSLILGDNSFKSISLIDHPIAGQDLLKKQRFFPYEVILYYNHTKAKMEFTLFKNKALILFISCGPCFGKKSYVDMGIYSAIHKGDDTVTLLYLITDDLGFYTDNQFNF
ncbi:MAG: hypothetical protein H6598_06145 [Flavobacteriales bacterium]|nr:hypothetical protein [Flavobacteriales bacterium]